MRHRMEPRPLRAEKDRRQIRHVLEVPGPYPRRAEIWQMNKSMIQMKQVVMEDKLQNLKKRKTHKSQNTAEGKLYQQVVTAVSKLYGQVFSCVFVNCACMMTPH